MMAPLLSSWGNLWNHLSEGLMGVWKLNMYLRKNLPWRRNSKGRNPEAGIRSTHLKSSKEAGGWGKERECVKNKRRWPWNRCLDQNRLGFEGHGKAVGFILSARGHDGRALKQGCDSTLWRIKAEESEWKMEDGRDQVKDNGASGPGRSSGSQKCLYTGHTLKVESNNLIWFVNRSEWMSQNYFSEKDLLGLPWWSSG